jgi:hypothetical protein
MRFYRHIQQGSRNKMFSYNTLKELSMVRVSLSKLYMKFQRASCGVLLCGAGKYVPPKPGFRGGVSNIFSG